MGITELFFIAVGLSMDAFAVSVCSGLGTKKLRFRNAVIVGLYFGIFQAGMPLIGYFVGVRFAEYITDFDHWIAFILLSVIGAKMIKDSFEKQDKNIGNNDESSDDVDTERQNLSPKKMLPLAVATSIDALAVGVSFAFLKADIVPAVTLIGIVTFTLSIIGVKIGNVFGLKYKSKAEFIGGAILILIGLKILIEHLGLI